MRRPQQRKFRSKSEREKTRYREAANILAKIRREHSEGKGNEPERSRM